MADCRFQGRLSYVHTTQSSGIEVEGESSPENDDTPTELEAVGTTVTVSSLLSNPKMSPESCRVEEDEHQTSGFIGHESPNQEDLTAYYASTSVMRPSYDPTETGSFLTSDPPTIQSQTREPHHSSISAFPAQRERYPLGPLKGLPEGYTDNSYANLEEACLIRHFTENLAPWVCRAIPHPSLHFLTKYYQPSSTHVIGTGILSFMSLNERCFAQSYGMRF